MFHKNIVTFINATILLVKRTLSFRDYKRVIFRILAGKKIDYYNCNYSNVISLGYNCEVSQRFTDIFVNSEFKHFLFSWSYENDRELFLKALKNLDYFTDSNYFVLPDGMIKNEKYDINFHSIFPKELLLMNDNPTNISPFVIDELLSRLDHLALNLLQAFCDENSNILFVIKLKYSKIDDDIDFIKRLNNILKNNFVEGAKYTLLVILSRQDYKRKYRNHLLNNKIENVEFATISRFAADPYTDVDGDIFGWYKVLKTYIKQKR